MPKQCSTRYQKFLKSERAKTKLKAKKDLPKGTNVTKTNFKVKKIIIKEQLKSHEQYEALSKRKLSVKELLSKLNHFNTKSRTDALDGIKELISGYPDILDSNLGQLIHQITPQVLNVEKIVRRESLKVLHLILSNIQKERINPFFDVMCTYLRSAMTHIDSRIQDDALLFLDVLLLCTPEKIAQEFHKVIPNFMDMISKLRTDSKPGRTLTVNLDSQMTSVRWRVKVLLRLQEFLSKFVHYNKSKNLLNNVSHNVQYFNKKSGVYPLANGNFKNCQISCFSAKSQDTNTITDDTENMKGYIDTLMPLLFETWLEVSPNITKNDQNTETVLSEESAVLLKHMLDVIFLLWEYIQDFQQKYPNIGLDIWFTNKFKQQFTQHIVSAFPYVTNIRSQKGPKVSDVFEVTITDPKMVSENLKICHLFAAFNPNVNLKTQCSSISAIVDYIETTFSKYKADDDNAAVIKVLDALFSNKLSGWTKNQSTLDAIFNKMVWAYFNKEMTVNFKQSLFTLLCKISLNEKLNQFHNTEIFQSWIRNLPDILLAESISNQTIAILHKFAVQNPQVFNQVVKPKLQGIIHNLPKIKIIEVDHVRLSCEKLYSLLYWISSWDNENLNLLENQIMNNIYGDEKSKFIIDLLKIKSEGIFE